MKQFKLEMRVGPKILKSWILRPNEFSPKKNLFVSQTYNYLFREYIIGRSPETSNICIEHSSLSRNHAKISVSENGSAVIQDLSSSTSKTYQ